jgi:hypothetical protein
MSDLKPDSAESELLPEILDPDFRAALPVRPESRAPQHYKRSHEMRNRYEKREDTKRVA